MPKLEDGVLKLGGGTCTPKNFLPVTLTQLSSPIQMFLLLPSCVPLSDWDPTQ